MAAVDFPALDVRPSTKQSESNLFSSDSKILEKNSSRSSLGQMDWGKETQYHLDPFGDMLNHPMPTNSITVLICRFWWLKKIGGAVLNRGSAGLTTP